MPTTISSVAIDFGSCPICSSLYDLYAESFFCGSYYKFKVPPYDGTQLHRRVSLRVTLECIRRSNLGKT